MRQVSGPYAAQLVAALTTRELELLALMAQGRSNSAISEDLCLSPKTVETHVRRIFWKFGLFPDGSSHRRVSAVLVYLQAIHMGPLPLLDDVSDITLVAA